MTQIKTEDYNKDVTTYIKTDHYNKEKMIQIKTMILKLNTM